MVTFQRQVRLIINNPIVATFLFLNIADLITTLIGLALGARELNPYAAQWIREYGPAVGVSSLKLLGAFAIIFALMRIQARRVRWQLHWHLMRVGNIVYAVIVFSNLLTIGRHLQALFF